MSDAEKLEKTERKVREKNQTLNNEWRETLRGMKDEKEVC